MPIARLPLALVALRPIPGVGVTRTKPAKFCLLRFLQSVLRTGGHLASKGLHRFGTLHHLNHIPSQQLLFSALQIESHSAPPGGAMTGPIYVEFTAPGLYVALRSVSGQFLSSSRAA
jgi:hypothetical protein